MCAMESLGQWLVMHAPCSTRRGARRMGMGLALGLLALGGRKLAR